MNISVIDERVNPDLLKRLMLLGSAVVQVEAPGDIKSIDRLSTDLVYLVSHELTRSPGWGDLDEP